MVSSAPSGVLSTRNCTPATATLSAAVALRLTVPDTVAPLAGAVRLTVGAVMSGLLTVTLTDFVVVLPAASRATAVSLWVPLATAAVFHDTLYGAVVSVAIAFLRSLSTKNCTSTTPTLSEAVALRVTVPDTVAPLAGAVRLIVGALVSPLGCGPAAFPWAISFGAVAPATSAVTGADNCMVDASVRACWSTWSPAVPRPSMVWLVSVELTVWLWFSSATCLNWRGRAPTAINANSSGESTGVSGPVGASGPEPAAASRPNILITSADREDVGSSGAAETPWAAIKMVCGSNGLVPVDAVTACGTAG